MDTIKSAVGLGKKDQEGEEPVSGEQGAGTTAEPHDAGNKQAQTEEATEAADTSTVEQKSPNSNADTSPAAEDDDSSKDKKKGGFLKAVSNPFSKSEKSEDDTTNSKQATAGAEQPKQDPEEEKNLPPNVLGSNVPTGATTDFAPPGPPGEGADPEQAKKEMAEQQNQSVKDASADNVDEPKFGQAGSFNPDAPRSDSKSGSQAGLKPMSQAQLRGSRASIAQPSKQSVVRAYAENPGRIPTAGGVAVGSKQFERRTSRVSQDLTPPQRGGGLDTEGSPDQSTQSNTFQNAYPQAQQSSSIREEDEIGGPKDTSNEAPPQFNTQPFGAGSTGEGAQSSSAAYADTTTNANTQTGATIMGGAAPTTSVTEGTEDKSKTEQLKEKAKENVPSSSGAGSSDRKTSDSLKPSGGDSKERRGSTFARFKAKLAGKD